MGICLTTRPALFFSLFFVTPFRWTGIHIFLGFCHVCKVQKTFFFLWYLSRSPLPYSCPKECYFKENQLYKSYTLDMGIICVTKMSWNGVTNPCCNAYFHRDKYVSFPFPSSILFYLFLRHLAIFFLFSFPLWDFTAVGFSLLVLVSNSSVTKTYLEFVTISSTSLCKNLCKHCIRC